MGVGNTLSVFRDAVVVDPMLGGLLSGTVSVDPSITDVDATRSLISGRLFDSEKLAGAYGGHYVWIPRYSDSRRVEDRGYRVRYVTVFAPPESGTYVLRFYGLGETHQIAALTPASSVQAACRNVSPDLIDLQVVAGSEPGTLVFFHQFRLGMGSSAGQILSQGGVGVCIVNRDFSQPLAAGEPWIMSAKISFEDEDGQAGLHTCINQALYDVMIPDLVPVTASLPASVRSRVLDLRTIANWLEPEDIIGYYAPTEWTYSGIFHPPTSGTYNLSFLGWTTFGPTSTPLAYNATGAAIQAALAAIPGLQTAVVSPQGAASSYTINLTSMYCAWALSPSSGWIESETNLRIREPYPVSIAPFYRGDFEASTITDPGYGEGQSWFIHAKRRAMNRICPQTYPRRNDGSLDLTARPIEGTVWMDSSVGLVNDLDQALPGVPQVTELALRYIYSSIEASSPRGEAAEWGAAGTKQAAIAAGKLVYGPIKRRATSIGRGGAWGQVGQKGLDWWMP